MSNPNQHIIEYLDYYLNELPEAPGFAIMIDGKWGSGKTHFIVREYLAKPDFKDKFLYVSLYGITKYSEIEAAFFEQLHPFLASKGAKMGGLILKGLLKTTLKIDLNGDQKEEGAISSQLPDINVSEVIGSSNSRFLVFDDLERCNIDIKDILGYINNFVENKGYKAIIIANEEEIQPKIQDDEPKPKESNENTLPEKVKPPRTYDLIKEKLIGRTFKIEPNFSAAYSHFLETVKIKIIQDLLKDEQSTLETIFKDSGFENVRIIKHLFFDLNRFFQFIPEFAWKGDPFHAIFRYFICFYVELKNGRLFGLQDIVKVAQMQTWLTSFDTENRFNFRIKYSSLDSYLSPFSGKELHSFFSKGLIDMKESEVHLNSTPYFFTDKTESWKKLSNIFQLDDKEFFPLVEDVFEKLKNKEYEDPFVILQVVGIFISLSKNFENFKYKGQFIPLATANVQDLLSKQVFKIENQEWEDLGYDGFGYLSKGSNEFIEFKDWLFGEMQKAYLDSFTSKAEELLDPNRTNISTLCEKISYTAGQSYDQMGEYLLDPIFSRDHSQLLFERYNWISTQEKKQLFKALDKRYNNFENFKKLKSEKQFLEGFVEELKKNSDFEKRPVSSQWEKTKFIPALQAIIEKMKNVREEPDEVK